MLIFASYEKAQSIDGYENGIKECSSVSDNLKRLACYDKLAASITVGEHEAATATPESEPRIDMSTLDKMKSSGLLVRQSLSGQALTDFDIAFEEILRERVKTEDYYKDEFNYSIPGGVEPGEEATWALTPSMFSDWGKIDAPPDANFIVVVERIDGPDGKQLFRKFGLDEYELGRLKRLKEKYPDR